MAVSSLASLRSAADDSDGVPGPQPDAGRKVTRIGEIRSVPSVEPQILGEVTLRGVVTWSSQKEDAPAVVIDDGSDGILVWLPRGSVSGSKDRAQPIPIGTDLEVVATVDAPNPAVPALRARAIRAFGTAPLPEPRLSNMGTFLRGVNLHQRVRVSGVIQDVKIIDQSTAQILLARSSGDVHAIVKLSPDIDRARLADGWVYVQGTIMGQRNTQMEIVEYVIHAPIPDDLIVKRWGDADPFSAPELSLDAITTLVGQDVEKRRQRISGIVTYHSAKEFLYLQQGNRAIRVETISPVALDIGDRAVVAGFLYNRDGVCAMRAAAARRIRAGQPPAPIDVSLNDLFARDSPEALRPASIFLHGSVIRVVGELVECQQIGPGHRLLLTSGAGLITAELHADEADALGSLIPKSLLQVTGVAVVAQDRDARSGISSRPKGCTLLLRDTSDVRVIKAAPWWTAERLMIAMLTSVTVASVLGVGTLVLAHQVRRQTLALAEKSFAHRSLELEQETMLRERNRIAGEIHDSIQQLLAGLAFQLEALGDPGDTSRHVAKARSILVRIGDEFRKCVWDLRHMGRVETDPARSLRGIAALQQLCSDTLIDVGIEGPADPLPAPIMAPLSLVAREAVANAVAHGDATRIGLLYRRDETGVTLEISDDGSGFSPDVIPGAADGHFGLSNMRERIAAVGGSLDIDSQPSRGTRVTARIPAAALAAGSSDAPLQMGGHGLNLNSGGKDGADTAPDRG